MINEVLNKLQYFDWTYENSDDHSTWKKVTLEKENILFAINRMEPIELSRIEMFLRENEEKRIRGFGEWLYKAIKRRRKQYEYGN